LNYVIIAARPDGRSYVASTRHQTLTDDANEAARFVQLESAMDSARAMIEHVDFERTHGVTLSIGLVRTVVDDEVQLPRKSAKPGFIIVFAHVSHDDHYGRYSTAPKKPKEFDYQHCVLASKNIDKATRYNSLSEAQARVKLMTDTVLATCAQYSADDRRRHEESLLKPWLYQYEFVDTWGNRAKEFKLEIQEVT
jgi:hypothetical protein